MLARAETKQYLQCPASFDVLERILDRTGAYSKRAMPAFRQGRLPRASPSLPVLLAAGGTLVGPLSFGFHAGPGRRGSSDPIRASR